MSVTKVTDESGEIVREWSFDAFGKIRDPETWEAEKVTNPVSPESGYWNLSTRAYTGHEQLLASDLVHMNGRLYDPTLGRTISSDPYVPYPLLTQSYNRLSYVQNNPMSRVDMSGFSDSDGSNRPPPPNPIDCLPPTVCFENFHPPSPGYGTGATNFPPAGGGFYTETDDNAALERANSLDPNGGAQATTNSISPSDLAEVGTPVALAPVDTAAWQSAVAGYCRSGGRHCAAEEDQNDSGFIDPDKTGCSLFEISEELRRHVRVKTRGNRTTIRITLNLTTGDAETGGLDKAEMLNVQRDIKSVWNSGWLTDDDGHQYRTIVKFSRRGAEINVSKPPPIFGSILGSADNSCSGSGGSGFITLDPCANGELFKAGTPAHELGHALGLRHERHEVISLMNYNRNKTLSPIDLRRLVNLYSRED